MAKVSPLMIIPPVLFAIIAGLFYVGMRQNDGDELPTALAGKPAPMVPDTPLGDYPVFTLADLADGQVKLVNFWASWCAPCRTEHPKLETLAKNGMPVYGINYKDQPAQAMQFLKELGNPYAGLVSDQMARAGLEWGVYGVPETFIVDGQGRIIDRMAGPVTDRAIETRLKPALAKIGATLPQGE